MSVRVYGRSCDRCGEITTAVEDDRLCRRCAADELCRADRQR
jgi:RNA polymerase subunit RPABC4/transcription elongation factor Spt4